ncbi:hypothetical protein Tola_1913 [Tolumonas auensis DSM 9187]|uniref:Uncharacterized protein n=1 Tax=Tolumonas auensis (strain DSM 9187 / NBRC 110442 / TA 4) TaxID=595494 RepID=C4LFZ9_TOLAT|nr:hypothetical protein [Tolumonas auensis]ACQ93516.1 hypothetical protein Tola_1913 [Tolumonas auensis DSM 9187]
MIVDDMTDMPAILTEVPISNTGHQDDFQCIKSLIFPDDLWDPAIDWKLWHAVIIYNLKKLIADPTIKLHASFLSLVDTEIQWINELQFTPESDVEYHLLAKAFRQELKGRRIIGHYYLIDGILSELTHSVTLNGDLFKCLKKITILAVLAILRINDQNNVSEDKVIETAIRNIRLFTNNRRSSFATSVSAISFGDRIDEIISSIHEECEKCVQDNSVKVQLANLHQILNRLYEHRVKREHSGERAQDEKDKKLEIVSRYHLDNARIDVLSDISCGKGRKYPMPWSEEEQLGNTRNKETYLVSQKRTKHQDLLARRLQAKSVAQSISIRTQALPCSSSMFSVRQIQKVVSVLLQQMCSGNIAALQLFFQLLLGMSSAELGVLPVASRRIGKSNVENDTCWLIRGKDKIYLQRLVKVANSNVHKKLSKLLPSTDFFISLPLPDVILPSWKPEYLRLNTQKDTAKILAEIYKKTGIKITHTQVSNFLVYWLQATHVDQAITGVLSGKSVKQCAPIAYSYIYSDFLLDIWQEYVTSLGIALKVEEANDAIGSRLYPKKEKFVLLIQAYQAHLKVNQRLRNKPEAFADWHNAFIRHCVLILNLSTAARPVTEMYGSRHDYCLLSRLIRISDKEARSVPAGRLIPLTNLAVQQLKFLEKHLLYMADCFKYKYPDIAHAAEIALSGEGPLLFWLREPEITDMSSSYEIELISPISLDHYFDNLLPLPVNWHRHAVRSHLLCKRVPSVLIDAMMGHENMGHEYAHSMSAASLQELFIIPRVLDDWFSEIKLECIEGW